MTYPAPAVLGLGAGVARGAAGLGHAAAARRLLAAALLAGRGLQPGARPRPGA